MTQRCAMVSTLVLASLCGACSTPTWPVAAEGDLAAEVVGTTTRHLRGEARNAMISDRWAVFRATPELGVSLLFDGGRPGQGVYGLEPRSIPRGSITVDQDIQFNSISGTIRITESSPVRVAGVFEFVAEQVVPRDPAQTLRVRGSFDIACAVACA